MKFPSAARLLVANVLLASGNFFTSVLLARALDPQVRGVLANVALWPTLLSHIGLCGVHMHLSLKAAASPRHVRACYRQGYRALLISVAFATSSYVILRITIGTRIISDLGALAVLAALLIIPFSAWNALQGQMELGRKSIATYNFARGSFSIAYLVLVTLLFATESHQALPYLWAFVIAAAIAAIATHWVIDRATRSALSEMTIQIADRESLLATFTASTPFALSIGLNTVAFSADRMAISLFFDAEALGIYVVALALSQIQSVVTEAISPLFFSAAARIDHVAHTEPGWLAMRLRQSILINVAICGAVMTAAPALLPLVYGAAYNSALPLVMLLLPATCARAMMRPFEELLRGMNQPLSQSLAIAANSGVFFLGAAIAASMGSVLGVALALLVASATGLIMAATQVAINRTTDLPQVLLPRIEDMTGLLAELRRIIRA
jgi:O-antigen/teichoic acid export membrane protein